MFVQKPNAPRTTAACAAAFLVFVAWPVVATAADALTLERALALARERAPAILASRGRIDEARGRLVGASRLVQQNPVIQGGGGYRSAGQSQSTREGRVAINQELEVGSKRRARMNAAEAGVARAAFDSDDTTRFLLRDVALAFFQALYAQERRQLASAIEELNTAVLHTAERRHLAGDIPRLDVGLAQAAVARSRADVHANEASCEAALAQLRLLLGLPAGEALSIQGDFRQHPVFDLQELLTHAADRSDLRAIEAELREQRAARDVGAAQRLPNVGIGGVFERHEDANIGLAMFSLSIPAFDRGQGLIAEAEAGARRVEQQLLAARNAAAIEIRAAFAVYQRRQAAVDELEQHALPLLDENEAQLRRGYEAGQIAFTELLAARREINETRISYLERLLEARSASVEVNASANLFRLLDGNGPPADTTNPSAFRKTP